MSRVALVSATGSYIAALQSFSVTTVNPTDLPTSAPKVAQYLSTSGADVIVFGPDISPPLAFATADSLRQTSPEVEVVVIHPLGPELVSQAMRSGVREILPPELGAQSITDGVARVVSAVDLRRERLAAGATPTTPTDPGAVISVMAAKGGVGKTTIAVNLAVELARNAPNEVVLVDLDLMAGEVDLVLGLEPAATVASLTTPGSLLDPTVVKLSLTAHPSGLLVLPAPAGLVEADGVDCNLLLELLTMLAAGFRFVVLDTAPGAGEALAAAVEASTELLAVATADIGGLYALKRNLDGLEQLGLSSANRRLILNRSDYRTGMSSQAVENAVGLPIQHSIPDCREIAVAANQGMPFVDAYPKAAAVGAFRELAQTLAPAPPAASTGRMSSSSRSSSRQVRAA